MYNMQTIRIKVRTKAGKSEILGYDDEKEAQIVAVKAAPEKGKANLEIIKLFHKKYKQPVKIISGAKSKEKLLQIG